MKLLTASLIRPTVLKEVTSMMQTSWLGLMHLSNGSITVILLIILQEELSHGSITIISVELFTARTESWKYKHYIC
jgi:hypothetical protein